MHVKITGDGSSKGESGVFGLQRFAGSGTLASFFIQAYPHISY